MKKIGLTGGIGAGKSMIAKILATMGFPVFYSDQVGKELMSTDSNVQSKIKTIFGDEAYFGGQLNRRYIAEKIFSDEKLKEEINSIIHPAVRSAFNEWANNQNAPFVFNEAAILFETGAYKNFDFNVLVSAPLDLRLQRVLKRDKTSTKEVHGRMENQWSDEKKRVLADFEIVNDNNSLIIPQIHKLLSELKKQ
jgi:dephospho-CoA kinase